MNQIVLIQIIISFTLACNLKQLRCEDLLEKISCDFVTPNIATCQWNEKLKQCQLLKANQKYCFNQDYCIKQNQEYDQIQFMEEKESSCEMITSFEKCIKFYNKDFGCTWKHNQCIQISSCSEINDFMQCRISKLKEKCQLVINGKSSSMERQYFFIGGLFDEYECRAKDCKFNLFWQCQQFVNGRRCFESQGKCTQCSYFTSKQSCIDSNQCTWQYDACRNILCSDFKGKQLCQHRYFCQFNDQNLLCETRTDEKYYCYAYDISSDPIKSKKRDDI